MNTKQMTAVVLFLLTSMALPLLAQPGPPLGMLGGAHAMWFQDDEDTSGEPGFGMRNAKTEMLLMWKLTEYLDLSEKQAESFFPKVKQHRDDIHDIQMKHKELHLEMTENIKAGKVSKKEIENYIGAVADLEKAKIDHRSDHYIATGGQLDDLQLAKYVTFEEYYLGQLKKRMARGRGSQQHRPQRGRGSRF